MVSIMAIVAVSIMLSWWLASWLAHSTAARGPGCPYLQSGQLGAVQVDPEGVQVFWAGLGHHTAPPQGHGRLAHLPLPLVRVEPQLAVPDQAPAATPLAVHQHVEVACRGDHGGRISIAASGYGV